MRSVNVHLLPSLTSAESLDGREAVVIDVLRATTTIVHALAAGAQAVIPCLEVEEARRQAIQLGEQAVLGGERKGKRISGFDLGNSPNEYTPETVQGKTVVFTTTNGTRAIAVCRNANRTLLAAFVNFASICETLGDLHSVELVCAGTRNEISREDVLLAGAIVDDLLRRHPRACLTNDQAILACDAWRSTSASFSGPESLAKSLHESRGGRNLLNIGQQQDIYIAAELDKFDLVPAWNPKTGKIGLV